VQKKASAPKRRWLIAVLALPLLLLIGILIAYAYIRSDSFTATLEKELASALGESVELGTGIKVSGVFPRVVLTLPSARLKTAQPTNGVQRARLQQLQVALSHELLFSRGSDGQVDITIQSVGVISQSGRSEASLVSDDQPTDDVGTAIDLAQSIGAIQEQIRGVKLNLDIVELTVFDQNEKTGNSEQRFSDLVVSVEHGTSLYATGNIHDDEAIKQTVSVRILDEAATTDLEQDTLAGVFDVSVDAIDDQFQSHTLTGEWGLLNNRISIADMQYKTDEAWLRGHTALEFNTHRIVMDSDLELRRWEISLGKQGIDQASSPESEQRLFSYEIFGSVIPHNLLADIQLRLGAIRVDGQPVVNGLFRVSVSEGVLDVSSEDLYLLGGAADVNLQLDNSLPQFLALDMKLDVSDAQLDRIRSADDSDTILSRGQADMIVALRGSGPSPGHLAATLDGYVIASVDNAQIRQKYSTLLDVGVLSWAIDKVSLLTKSDEAKRSSANLSDPLTIECASLRLYINDGKVEVSNGAIIEFPDNALFSSGFIDLKSETLGFAFRTKSRSLFDWSAIAIAKYAEIGGSLMSPSVTLNAQELAKQGLLKASSVAWGPLPSLVYSLAESGVKNMNSSECQPTID